MRTSHVSVLLARRNLSGWCWIQNPAGAPTFTHLRRFTDAPHVKPLPLLMLFWCALPSTTHAARAVVALSLLELPGLLSDRGREGDTLQLPSFPGLPLSLRLTTEAGTSFSTLYTTTSLNIII